MNEVKTDSEIKLSLGEHLDGSDPHVTFLALDEASSALVDVENERVVWLSRHNQMCWDPRVCGGKVKRAIKYYERHYGVKMQSGSDAPREDRSGLRLVGLIVRDGIVTSDIWTTQKFHYSWDWRTKTQLKTRGGRKYA